MTCTYENGIMNAEVIGMFKINPYRPGAGLMPTYLAGRDADMDAIRDLLDALKSVSYTHLDVYKRQGYAGV